MTRIRAGALLILFSTFAFAEETLWQDARVSMTRLLNDGWSIHGFSSIDTDWRRLPGPRDNVVAYPQRSEVQFVLTKNGKWIWCAVAEPEKEAKPESKCRLLN
jgi:hypothetical protein